MKTEARFLALSVLAILIISVFAYAIGTTTNNAGSNTNSFSNAQASTCASLYATDTQLRERLKCRLQRNETGPNIPEACRRLAATGASNTMSMERCRTLYQEIRSCYSETGIEKDRCLKLKTGFATSAVSGQGVNKEAARKYLVTLLYDLEDKVEAKQKAGEITAEQGADLITKITNIKEALLQGKPGSEIRPRINDLRTAWREVFG